jgi:hypothetical protein
MEKREKKFEQSKKAFEEKWKREHPDNEPPQNPPPRQPTEPPKP